MRTLYKLKAAPSLKSDPAIRQVAGRGAYGSDSVLRFTAAPEREFNAKGRITVGTFDDLHGRRQLLRPRQHPAPPSGQSSKADRGGGRQGSVELPRRASLTDERRAT